MAYSKAKIDETGLHIPTYIEIRDNLLQKYREIFGDDVYLENDSQDYEMISLFADKLYDAYEALHQAYNSRSPRTSIGSALDAVVAINGLRRKKASYSTCTLRLRGTKGTVIYNGSASDDKGARFMLPPEVEIPESGTIDVLATCNRTGPTTAAKDTVYNIDTPTRGWVSVTNPEPAMAGEAAETDATLRSRQAISTAKPSNTVLEGTVGGIAEISGVTRYRVYENDTSAPDEIVRRYRGKRFNMRSRVKAWRLRLAARRWSMTFRVARKGVLAEATPVSGVSPPPFATRTNGELYVQLWQPISQYATEAERFPQPFTPEDAEAFPEGEAATVVWEVPVSKPARKNKLRGWKRSCLQAI